MSVIEMKKEIYKRIDNINDELLIRQVMDLINNPEPRPSVEDIYAEIVTQYGNTLTKLAQ